MRAASWILLVLNLTFGMLNLWFWIDTGAVISGVSACASAAAALYMLHANPYVNGDL
jgi:hypothetical protein